MNRLLQLLLCLSISVLAASLLSAEEEKKVLPIMPLYPKKVYYIFEERVNVRATPNLKAKVLGVALIGEPVEIVTRIDKSEVLYDIEANWYKVRWRGRFCYIWGGLLSTYHAQADFDGDGRDEILMSRSLEVATTPVSIHTKDEFRLCRKENLISSEPFRGESPQFSDFSIFNDKGFKPEVTLLELTYIVGDGPVAGGATYLFYWSKDRFIKISEDEFEYVQQDARYNKYYFPSDEGGKANTLRIEHRVREATYKGDELHIKSDELASVKELFWDGEHFTPLENNKKEDKNE